MEATNQKNSSSIGAVIRGNGSLLALIGLAVIISVISPEFRTIGNFLSLLRQSTVNGFIAFGMTLVILTGGIDLSVGSILGLTAALCAGMITKGVPVPLAMLIALILGLLFGAISGILITIGKLQPFIATLVSMEVYRGFTLIFTGGRPISQITTKQYAGAAFLNFFGRGSIGPIPFPVIVFILVFCVYYILLNRTTAGRKVYAVGSNEDCAKLTGINSKKVKFLIYSASGLMAALAGLVLVSRLGSAQPTLGTGFEMDAIAATALGGTSMSGGRGKITGTLIGILIIAVLNNGLNILGVSSYWQDVVKGIVILIAVLSDRNK